MKRPILTLVIVILTVGLTYLLLRQVDAHDIMKVMLSVSPLWLAASFVVYLLSVVIRAARFQLLLKEHIPLGKMFSIACLHNLANNLLPSFIGEFSFVYLAQKTGKTTTGEATAVLVVCRLFDVLAVFALTAAALIAVPDAPAQFGSLLVAIGVLLVAIFLVLVALVVYKEHSIRFFAWLARIFHVGHLSVVKWGFEKVHEMVDALRRIHGSRTYLMMILVSVMVWVLSYMQTYVLMVAMGYTMTFMTVALGTSLYRLATILPLYGIGGFGTVELTWAAAFVLLGMSMQDAIVSGFAIHILTLAFVLLLGAVGAVPFMFVKKEPNEHQS